MLTLLTLLSAQAEEVTPNLDALISVSLTPVIHHPLLEIEPKTTSADFRSVLHEKQGQLVYCFESSLKRNPNLSGGLTMTMLVEEGVVETVSVVQNTFESEDLTQCVSGKLHSWRFSSELSGTFTLPFTCGVAPEAAPEVAKTP